MMAPPNEPLSTSIWDMAYNVWEFAELGFEEEESSAHEFAILEHDDRQDSL